MFSKKANLLELGTGINSTIGNRKKTFKFYKPKKGECTNILVPVCLSASHIVFGSIRIEPVFMVLGQSAATAACLAIDRNLPVQELPYNILKEKLESGGQIVSIPGSD